jgi:hypothetical protein
VRRRGRHHAPRGMPWQADDGSLWSQRSE